MQAAQSSQAKHVWEEIRDEAQLQSENQAWRSGDLQEFGIDRFLHEEVTILKTW